MMRKEVKGKLLLCSPWKVRGQGWLQVVAIEHLSQRQLHGDMCGDMPSVRAGEKSHPCPRSVACVPLGQLMSNVKSSQALNLLPTTSRHTESGHKARTHTKCRTVTSTLCIRFLAPGYGWVFWHLGVCVWRQSVVNLTVSTQRPGRYWLLFSSFLDWDASVPFKCVSVCVCYSTCSDRAICSSL